MKLTFTKSKEQEALEYLLQLSQNFMMNVSPDTSRRIRDFVRNPNYDSKTKEGSYRISSADEIKADIKLFTARKNNPQLNMQIQGVTGITTLTGLAIYGIVKWIENRSA